jgi:hypothetical protein
MPLGVEPVLLLTATVDPGACVMTARADPAQRLEDYRSALRGWIASRSFTRIVWCESSRWPLSAFADLQAMAADAHIALDLVSYFGQDFDMTLGKGYGELGIIQHAIDHVPALADDRAVIVKVTGRYVVPNIAPLLRLLQASAPPAFICDLRNDLTVADSRIFAATRSAMRTYLTPLRSLANDSAQVFFEHLLARAVHAAMGAGLAWRMMPMVPDVIGIGASTGKRHTASLSKILRHRLKRRLFSY